MEHLRKRLIEKGWPQKEISRAIRIIEHAKKNKHPGIKLLDKMVYWISLAIAILGNLIISVALVPFLLVLKNTQLYLVIITLGFSFGLLFELLVRKIENLTVKHHLFFGIFIPLLAILNFVIVSNSIMEVIGISSSNNPLAIGIIYAIAFMAPYIAYKIFLKASYPTQIAL